MRVGIDATCWSNRRGYGRFTRSLLHALIAADTVHEFVLFIDAQTYSQEQLPDGATAVVVPTTRAPTEAASADSRRSLRDLWVMTAAVARHKLDVFFFPSVYTYFPLITGATIILGVHDVIAEDYPDLIFPDQRGRRLWALKSWLAHRQADYILTVSVYAKSGIVRHFGHTPQRVWVVDEAPDPLFQPLSPEAIDYALLQRHRIAPDDRFFLYLGGINPHKNLAMLVDSLAAVRQQSDAVDTRLVIIGDIRADVFTPGLNALQDQIRVLGLEDIVHFTGFLPDADIVHFLNAAQAIVLPSFAEGFGLPAIEGAACGRPVVATHNSPLPDLLAGGGVFVDPARPDQLIQALHHILNDEGARRRMGQVALLRARQLSWQRSARQMETMLATVGRAR